MNIYRLLPRLVASLVSVVLLATTTQAVPLIRNVSARSNSTGLIAGFVIEGSQSKLVLIRVLGPALADPDFKITGTIPDPRAVLYDSRGTILAQNDDWASTTENKVAIQDAGAFPIAANSKDAVIVALLPPGAYTVMALPSEDKNKDSRPGICLIEVYDLSHARGQNLGSRLVNVSVRMIGTGSGNNASIVGIVFVGDGSQQVLMRAVGPTLALTPFNVTGVMADPKMLVYSTKTIPATLLGQNDNWAVGTGNITSTTFVQTGAFPLPSNSKDAAMVMPITTSGTAEITFMVEGTGAFLGELYLVRQ